MALLEVTRIDAEKRQVFFTYLNGEERSLPYDYLILATGVQQSYFGHDEFAAFAPGLKSINDATAIRAKLLKAFEIAEIEVDPTQHRDLLTFVLVGAGPIGVEMAEAVSALKAAGDTNRQLVESRPARAGTGFMNVSTRDRKSTRLNSSH